MLYPKLPSEFVFKFGGFLCSFFRAVTGKGKIAVKPDKIRLYVNKEELCKEYEDTLRRSTEDTELLKDLFEKLGFQRKDLKTVYFNVDTE